MLIIRPRPRFFVQPRNSLKIVIHDIGWGRLQNIKGPIKTATKIWHQDLDLGLRRLPAHFLNAFHKMLGTPIAEIIAIHAGDHDIAKLQRSDGLGKIDRLMDVKRIWPPMANITKWATACAFIAHDHEGGGALAEALPDIWAGGFFADCVQIVFAQNIFDF